MVGAVVPRRRCLASYALPDGRRVTVLLDALRLPGVDVGGGGASVGQKKNKHKKKKQKAKLGLT